MRYDSSDDNSSTVSRRRSTPSPKRLIKSSGKNEAPASKANNLQISNSNSLYSLVYERKGAETGILWNALPSNLVKFGKV